MEAYWKMKSRKLTLTLILIIALATLCSSFQVKWTSAQSMKILIEPEIATAEPDTEFTVELNIRNSEKIYAWYVNITWNTQILNVTALGEGSFLNQEGSRKTDFIYPLNLNVPNSNGWIYFGCCLKGESSTAQPTGSGTLAYLTFTVLKPGETDLNFTKTLLFNYWGEISHTKYTTVNGSFKYPYFTVLVDPEKTSDPNLTVDTTFNVNITAFVNELYRWHMNLTWNNAVLEMVEAVEGTFLTSGGTYSSNFTRTIVQAEGYALLNCTLLEPAAPANGTGTLATITFKVKALGESDIRLEQAELYDREGVEIAHGIIHGEFTNVIHDVAVLDIDVTGINDNQVAIGSVVTIVVTVKNKGNMPEIAELKVYYGLLPIYTNSSINLGTNETKQVTFSWDTSGLSKGQEELKASLTPLPYETLTADNDRVYGTIPLVEAGAALSNEVIIAIVVIVIIVALVAFLIIKKRKS